MLGLYQRENPETVDQGLESILERTNIVWELTAKWRSWWLTDTDLTAKVKSRENIFPSFSKTHH